jgi:hypothetical protein
MSTDLDLVSVQAFGNWFSFKPGQIKPMDDRIANFLAFEKRAMGFVLLPEECEDRSTPEAKAIIEEKTREGRANIVAHLNSLIHNLEVSLAAEYERVKEKVPMSITASHAPHYRKLAALKAADADRDQAVVDEIEKLKGVISGASNSTDAPKTNPGRKESAKSA